MNRDSSSLFLNRNKRTKKVGCNYVILRAALTVKNMSELRAVVFFPVFTDPLISIWKFNRIYIVWTDFLTYFFQVVSVGSLVGSHTQRLVLIQTIQAFRSFHH